LVDIVAQDDLPDGWLHVLDSLDCAERPVALAHADLRTCVEVGMDALQQCRPQWRSRPGGPGPAVARVANHGVSVHVEDKRRPSLWGTWAGDPLDDIDVAALDRLASRLGETQVSDRLCELLTGRK
jgi:hypothetical protein